MGLVFRLETILLTAQLTQNVIRFNSLNLWRKILNWLWSMNCVVYLVSPKSWTLLTFLPQIVSTFLLCFLSDTHITHTHTLSLKFYQKLSSSFFDQKRIKGVKLSRIHQACNENVWSVRPKVRVSVCVCVGVRVSVWKRERENHLSV